MPPYWQARISEVVKLREDLAKEGLELEEVSHVRADDNLADLGTRGTVKLRPLVPRSMWQNGPNFLALPRMQWPLKFLAGINLHKAVAAPVAAKLAKEGAKPVGCEVLSISAGTEVQMRRQWVVRHLQEDVRVHKMAKECLVKYNLATSKRILVRLLRAIFNYRACNGTNRSLVEADIRSPVSPAEAAVSL